MLQASSITSNHYDEHLNEWEDAICIHWKYGFGDRKPDSANPGKKNSSKENVTFYVLNVS